MTDTEEQDARRRSILEDIGLQGILEKAERDFGLNRQVLVDEYLALPGEDESLTDFLKEKAANGGTPKAKGVEQ